MKKDIQPPVVEEIAVAVIQEENELNELEWNVYLINMKSEDIEGVLVTSKGYGMYDGKEVKTSSLRHFLDVVKGKSYKKIEPIKENVFGLNNEYWLSFYLNKVMHDKKYIFLPETIQMDNFIMIPLINKPGVMIK